jgi:hypothetical protein
MGKKMNWVLTGYMGTEVGTYPAGMTARKLALLEKDFKDRLNVHESAIVTIFQRVMGIIDPPALPAPPRRRIGFGTGGGAGVRSQRRCGR